MKKKFVWEKWHNPFEEEMKVSSSQPPENEVDFYNEEAEEQPHHMQIQEGPPFGYISALLEHNRFLDSFDFWVLHTNFDITIDIKEFIESTPGVESLDIMTRYRARIGMTKAGLFNNTQVKQMIQNKIIAIDEYRNKSIETEVESQDFLDFDEMTKATIEKIKLDLESRGNNWVFYVFPNGEFSIYDNETTPEIEEKAEFLRTLEFLIGGRVFTNP
jgi:hypothetical protein